MHVFSFPHAGVSRAWSRLFACCYLRFLQAYLHPQKVEHGQVLTKFHVNLKEGSLPRSKDISGVALRCNSFENPNGWGPQIAQTAHLSLPQICPFFAAILGQHPSQLGGW